MKCRDCRNLLIEYIEQSLPQSEYIAVSKHLKECRACQTELILLRKIDKVLSKEEFVSAPEGFTERLIASLPARELVVPRISAWQRLRVPVYAVAGALSGFFIFLYYRPIINFWERVLNLPTPKLPQLANTFIATLQDWGNALLGHVELSLSPELIFIMGIVMSLPFLAWGTYKAVSFIRT
jgi:hypothetical protein